MPQITKPTSEQIQIFLATQAELPYTYVAVGATAAEPPAGYAVDHTRRRLGSGCECFEAAVAALKRWDHFRLGWVEATPAEPEIRPGVVVAVHVKIFGVHWLNACRVVYMVNEITPALTQWGFAYGTLPGHAERGEERFQIEWNHADDSVWYDILAFSRARHPLARLGYPMVRRLQKRFARASADAMEQSTHVTTENTENTESNLTSSSVVETKSR